MYKKAESKEIEKERIGDDSIGHRNYIN